MPDEHPTNTNEARANAMRSRIEHQQHWADTGSGWRDKTIEQINFYNKTMTGWVIACGAGMILLSLKGGPNIDALGSESRFVVFVLAATSVCSQFISTWLRRKALTYRFDGLTELYIYQQKEVTSSYRQLDAILLNQEIPEEVLSNEQKKKKDKDQKRCHRMNKGFHKGAMIMEFASIGLLAISVAVLAWNLRHSI